MKLIIGLGNPGKEYEHNRHNVGYLFIDFFSKGDTLRRQGVTFLHTDCFMNESGKFVAQQLGKLGGVGRFGGENLFIVHDDLDIPFGQFKIQFGVGPRVHNGILSIEQALGTKEFWRVRIGTDNRQISNLKSQISNLKLGETGKKYVLGDFSEEEIKVLEELFPKILDELEKLI